MGRVLIFRKSQVSEGTLQEGVPIELSGFELLSHLDDLGAPLLLARAVAGYVKPLGGASPIDSREVSPEVPTIRPLKRILHP